ncbi:Protein H01M10.2 [Aphelenchoides avenae]|nr:Protein H01M10.2 [Aphelenchus avenae]
MQVFNEALQRAEGSGEPPLDVVQVNETGLNDNATLSLISENDVEIPQPAPQVAPAAPPPRILADVPRTLKSEPFGKLVFEGNGDLLSNPTFRMNCSPPVSWTFCQPTCGSGDQAVDIENAKENSFADIFSAINGAFGSLGLGPVPEANVNVTYSPRNTLLDEFGEYFDRDGYRYRTINNAVRYRIQISAKGKVEENSVEVMITIRSTYALREQLWKKFATRFASILTAEKHAFLYDIPTLLDAKRTNNFLFF